LGPKKSRIQKTKPTKMSTTIVVGDYVKCTHGQSIDLRGIVTKITTRYVKFGEDSGSGVVQVLKGHVKKLPFDEEELEELEDLVEEARVALLEAAQQYFPLSNLLTDGE
jgi:hypothetical protein